MAASPRHAREFHIMPQTFVLPHEYTAFVAAFYAAATTSTAAAASTATTAAGSSEACADATASTADAGKLCTTTT
jgi:hypothetical protein